VVNEKDISFHKKPEALPSEVFESLKWEKMEDSKIRSIPALAVPKDFWPVV